MTTVSLSPATRRWTIYEGATFTQQITVLTAGIGSTPVSLTGYHGILTIRDAPAGNVLLILTDTRPPGLTFGGSLGTIDIVISSTLTSQFDWKQAFFDLLITEPDGTVDVILKGNFAVTGLIS